MENANRQLLDALNADAPVETIVELLNQGADPNALDADGMPVLFAAGGGARLRALIEGGGNVHATWDMGPTDYGPVARLMLKLTPKEHRPAVDAHVILRLCDIELEPETIRLLVARGFDPFAFERHSDPSEIAIALGTDRISESPITLDDLNHHGTARAGTANPEPYLPAFWREQIRTMRSGYAAEVALAGKRDYGAPSVPVWCFDRFGQTATRLPDGRVVLIAGEHEDHYDPDFCIYADVTVVDGNGGVDHYIYPAEVFPPTDFHTATLLDDHILVIGSLGYQDQRREGETQVLRLNLDDFSIHPVPTTGDNPGWIHRHTAERKDREIHVTDGKVEPGYRDNDDTFVLDLDTFVWRRAERDIQ